MGIDCMHVMHPRVCRREWMDVSHMLILRHLLPSFGSEWLHKCFANQQCGVTVCYESLLVNTRKSIIVINHEHLYHSLAWRHMARLTAFDTSPSHWTDSVKFVIKTNHSQLSYTSPLYRNLMYTYTHIVRQTDSQTDMHDPIPPTNPVKDEQTLCHLWTQNIILGLHMIVGLRVKV